MEKKRLVVMNRQCITQVVGPDSKWRDAKIEKAVERPPGIYNLHTAVPADPAKTHDGVILYVDPDHVYQQVGKAIVTHEARRFDRVPDLGAVKALSYTEDRVLVGPTQGRQRTRTL
ncbi:MAG: conjugal transfer protein TraO [Proteobacteria bacterium]|nr:MAG: conjugal transfer protein TraO [Pseudomonadota bacterium]